MFVVSIFDGPSRIGEIRLAAEAVTIGRDPGNTIVLADPSVSEAHAVLEPWGRFAFIRDRGAGAGTFLNDRPVKVDLIETGDAIRIGRYTLRVEAGVGTARTPEADPARALQTTEEPRPAAPKEKEPSARVHRQKILIAFARKVRALTSRIQGDAAILRPALQEESYEAEVAASLEKDLRTLSDLAGHLLEFAEMESEADRGAEKARETDPGRLLRKAAGAASDTARARRILVSDRSPERLPQIAAAEGRLQRALNHILASLAELTAEGGILAIEAAAEGGLLRISISSDEAPDASRVFEEIAAGCPSQAAQETAASASGAGLGLALAHQVILEHGGRMSLKTSDGATGRGVVLTVSLPVAPTPAATRGLPLLST